MKQAPGTQSKPWKALEVRQHFGLADDSDLAYAFENYQDAMSAGGHALAAQWASARSKADEGLLAAGARAVEDSGAGSARDRVPKPTVKPMIQETGSDPVYQPERA